MSLISSYINRTGASVIETDKQSSSKLNCLVPFYSLFIGKTIIRGEDKTLLYSSPDTSEELESYSYYILKKYEQAVNHMRDSLGLKILKTTRNPNLYLLTKGFLGFRGDDFNIHHLIVLCVKSKDIYSLDKANLDKTKFCLVIDNKVFEKQHVLMYKNIKKYYIDPLIKEGVDVMYTNNSDKWIYNQIDFIPKFNSITDLQQHLNTISEIALDIKPKHEKRNRELEVIYYTPDLPF